MGKVTLLRVSFLKFCLKRLLCWTSFAVKNGQTLILITVVVYLSRCVVGRYSGLKILTYFQTTGLISIKLHFCGACRAVVQCVKRALILYVEGKKNNNDI